MSSQNRIRIKIDRDGEKGISMSQLIEISDRLLSFIRSLCDYCNIEFRKEDWIALRFQNRSLDYNTINSNIDVNSSFWMQARNVINLIDDSSNMAIKNINKPYKSLLDIADPISFNQKIRIGIFGNSSNKWSDSVNVKLDKNTQIRKIKEMKNFLPTKDFEEECYIGTIKGTLYSWQKEIDEPFIKVRELVTGKLISCYYDEQEYESIFKLFKNKESIALISGFMQIDVEDKKIVSIKIRRVDIAPEFEASDWDKFFGCAPQLTKGLSSGQYIEGLYDE